MTELHVLYRLYGADGALLYVGLTNNPPIRFRSHEAQKSWWSDVATIKMDHYPSRDELAAAEASAIRNEQPRYNIIQAHPRAAARAKQLNAAMTSYSLAEVAAMVLPPEWSDGERWLARRLNRGLIRGYRLGRTWRMTDNQVQDLIERLSNQPAQQSKATPASASPTAVIDGLSPQSRARLRSV